MDPAPRPNQHRGQLRPGQVVHLRTPDNARLDGAAAKIVRVETWGAHVLTAAAGTGQFRALHEEIVVDGADTNAARIEARDKGMTGDACETCGGFNMVRSGPCLKCLDCGAAGGCG